jgi:PAS domain S-box-containing protein
MAKIHRPDLIISDALMPLMDGFEFLRQIKEDETLRATPFIFYSAIYKADKDVDLALALGAEAYIIKPKTPAEFWEEVDMTLQNRGKEKTIPPELIREDEEYLKRYSQVVAAKLEEKIKELEGEISERRRVEGRLSELEYIVNMSPAVVFLRRAAADWPVEFVSRNIEQFGYTAEDFTSGRVPYASIIYPEDLERVGAEVAEYTRQKIQGFSQEYRIIGKSGKTFWIDDRTWVRRDPAGNVTHYQGVVVDITERKQTERELKERVEELEKFYAMAVGRELRMKELKKEIEQLKEALRHAGKGAK